MIYGRGLRYSRINALGRRGSVGKQFGPVFGGNLVARACISSMIWNGEVWK